MIKTAMQLKALTRNRSEGDSFKAQVLIRNFMMERLLERIALSSYKDNFILKGGLLISSLVGNDYRKTMDMDTTIKNIEMSVENVRDILAEICAVELDDNVSFEIISVDTIMDEAEYGGLRVNLKAKLDMMLVPLKIDISTGDIITPDSVEYEYKLLYENRNILIRAYNLETVLAEKIETILARSTANTRLRDFYDLYILQAVYSNKINMKILNQALVSTSEKRLSSKNLDIAEEIFDALLQSDEMRTLWKNYQSKFDYAEGLDWDIIMESVRLIYNNQKEYALYVRNETDVLHIELQGPKI